MRSFWYNISALISPVFRSKIEGICSLFCSHYFIFIDQFYDSYTGEHLATHCGYGERFVEGASNSVIVNFTTDGTVTRDGWRLNWARKYLSDTQTLTT